MRKIYLLTLLALLSIQINAQVTLDGSTIFLSSGSVFHVNDSVIMESNATITNNGVFEANNLYINSGTFSNNTGASTVVVDTLYINDNITNDNTLESGRVVISNTGVLNNNGELLLNKGLRTATAGSALNTATGAITFVGPDDNKRLDLDPIASLNVRKLNFNATTNNLNIFLESVINVSDTVDFMSGVVQYDNPVSDQLIVLGSGRVLADTNGASIMAGSLFRFPNPAETNYMRFPVGEAGKYRPLWVTDPNYPGAAPLLEVEYLGTRTVTTTNAYGYSPDYNQNSWALRASVNPFDSSRVQVQFAAAELGGNSLNEVVVTEGFEIIVGDTIYYNLGQSASTVVGANNAVTSFIPAQGNSVLMVGQSTELKLNILAILEGAVPSFPGTIMETGLTDTLKSIFEFGGSGSKPMVFNKPVPAGAVDSLKLYLRATVNGPVVDSSSVWLMTDGTIRDYFSGELPYAVFTNAAAGSYFVIVHHRNHLRVQSTSAIALSNVVGTTLDFTNISNIRGGGGIKMASPTIVAIAAGNSNGDNEVNASDYYDVGWSQNALETGYRNTDVLFINGQGANVNVNDFNKVQENSNVVYFSTVP